MLEIFKSHHPMRHAKSFRHAFEGIFHALLNEPNFRVQIVIVALSVYFGKVLGITNVEWGILVISLGLLLAAELINTVVEELMDHFVRHDDPVVKIIKDLTAGFVLITAFTALIILFLIFEPRVRSIVMDNFVRGF